jgi:histone-lysine N-methyltransferase SETMAR
MAENFMEQNGMESMPHPPYSPDLAPSDFFSFPLVKKRLGQFECDDRDDLLEAITEFWPVCRLTICNAFSRNESTESES